MKKARMILWVVLILGCSIMWGGGCSTDADKASENISKDAEQFKVARKIVGINGITDKVEFEVTGRCSYEHSSNELVLTCREKEKDKSGPAEYKKHTIGLSDNMFFISTQLEPIHVSIYRTKIILKPENIVPDIDLVTGDSNGG